MSDCRLTFIAEHESGQFTYTCQRCKREHRSRYTPELIHRACTAGSKCKDYGPGTELERILKWFGVRVKRGCGCGDWVRWMNAIGVEGCREPANMAAIVERLKEHAPLAPRWAIRLIVLAAIRRTK